MVDLDTLLIQLITELGDAWERSGNSLTAPVGSSGRHQRIRIRHKSGQYIFTSGVLGSNAVRRNHRDWRTLARLVWRINSDQELVCFRFDGNDRLIGEIRHPVEHLDYDELHCYVLEIANACDRLEYLLTGRDVF